MKLNRTTILFLIFVAVAVTLAIPAIKSGSIWLAVPGAWECRQYGEGLGRPWQWNAGACFIQQPDGTITRVDTQYLRRP